jgi:hypothetical protein
VNGHEVAALGAGAALSTAAATYAALVRRVLVARLGRRGFDGRVDNAPRLVGLTVLAGLAGAVVAVLSIALTGAAPSSAATAIATTLIGR